MPACARRRASHPGRDDVHVELACFGIAVERDIATYITPPTAKMTSAAKGTPRHSRSISRKIHGSSVTFPLLVLSLSSGRHVDRHTCRARPVSGRGVPKACRD